MYSLIFEHTDFLILNKEQGVCVQDEYDEHQQLKQLGLINYLKQQNGQDYFLVHRLDKVTSGLLIVARNEKAASELSQLFQQRQIEKYYLAISRKKPKKKQGLICGDMERSRRSSWKLLKTQNNPAITQFFSFALNQGRRLFIVKPSTGKTHQIRVALKSLGSPIENDVIYGGQTDIHSEGIALHALSLAFSYQGEAYRFTEMPSQQWFGEVSEEVLYKARHPWELSWPKLFN